jgi:uncharacterized protein YecE (DUF72 family)
MATVSLYDVHLGTSSWQFDAWRGVFYPVKLARTRYLPYYVGQFDTVEVNTSFYALPAPSTLVNWVESAPAGFTYALKFPRSISHDKRLVDCGDETRAFLDALRALGTSAAPAFLQLPPDCTRSSCGRALAAYLDWLAPLGADLRLAVEVRAADLMTPAFAAFVAERGFALVMVEREGQPDVYPIWQQAMSRTGAPDFAFIRWIGDDRHGPAGDRELQVHRDDDLARWAARIAELTVAGKAVYGYMHNPYEGHSPASLRRLQAKLAEHGTLPPWPAAGAGVPQALPLL